MAATIKAVGTDLTFRQSNRLNQGLQRIKFQRAEAKMFGNDADHLLVLRRIGLCVILQILVLIALQFLDDSAGDQL